MQTKALTIPTKELAHMKVILAAWYNFLKEIHDSGKIPVEEFTEFLKANVVYDMDKDQVDLILHGKDEILIQFKEYVFGSN